MKRGSIVNDDRREDQTGAQIPQDDTSGVGYGGRPGRENAQNRIAHYERGTRVPQKELLDRMAEVLNVNRYMLYDLTGQNNSEFIQMMFRIEEVNPGIFRLF